MHSKPHRSQLEPISSGLACVISPASGLAPPRCRATAYKFSRLIPGFSSSAVSSRLPPAMLAALLKATIRPRTGARSAASTCTRPPPRRPSGRDTVALREWSLAIRSDPELPEAYLGRARLAIRLKDWDLALADLEQAAAWAQADPAPSLRSPRLT